MDSSNIKINPEGYDAIVEAYLRQQQKGLEEVKEKAQGKDPLEFAKEQIAKRFERSEQRPVEGTLKKEPESDHIKKVRQEILQKSVEEKVQLESLKGRVTPPSA